MPKRKPPMLKDYWRVVMIVDVRSAFLVLRKLNIY